MRPRSARGPIASCRRVLAGAAFLSLTVTAVAQAQRLRTVEFARQQRDTLPLDIRVDYAAGKVAVHGAERPMLYAAQLSYDPRRSEPIYAYDAETRRLRVGARKPQRDASGGAKPELRLDVTRSAPVSLSLRMGTAEADLDLGGMRLTRLSVESGASDAVLHFDTPNLVPMQRLDLDVGAASVRARGLANARTRDLRVKVGVGTAELEFGGEWAGDMELDLQVALGKATIRVPQDVGVRVETTRVLASFEREGFVKRDGAYYSANWAQAARKLHIRSRMVLGELELARGAN